MEHEILKTELNEAERNFDEQRYEWFILTQSKPGNEIQQKNKIKLIQN